jgi:hypothetical protein
MWTGMWGMEGESEGWREGMEGVRDGGLGVGEGGRGGRVGSTREEGQLGRVETSMRDAPRRATNHTSTRADKD